MTKKKPKGHNIGGTSKQKRRERKLCERELTCDDMIYAKI